MCCAVNMTMQLFREDAILLLLEPEGFLVVCSPELQPSYQTVFSNCSQSHSSPSSLAVSVVEVALPPTTIRLKCQRQGGRCLLTIKQAKGNSQRQNCKNQVVYLLFVAGGSDYASFWRITLS